MPLTFLNSVLNLSFSAITVISGVSPLPVSPRAARVCLAFSSSSYSRYRMHQKKPTIIPVHPVVATSEHINNQPLTSCSPSALSLLSAASWHTSLKSCSHSGVAQSLSSWQTQSSPLLLLCTDLEDCQTIQEQTRRGMLGG